MRFLRRFTAGATLHVLHTFNFSAVRPLSGYGAPVLLALRSGFKAGGNSELRLCLILGCTNVGKGKQFKDRNWGLSSGWVRHMTLRKVSNVCRSGKPPKAQDKYKERPTKSLKVVVVTSGLTSHQLHFTVCCEVALTVNSSSYDYTVPPLLDPPVASFVTPELGVSKSSHLGTESHDRSKHCVSNSSGSCQLLHSWFNWPTRLHK